MPDDLKDALEALKAAYGPSERWADPSYVVELSDKLKAAISDDDISKLLAELTEFTDARTRRIELAATIVRALTVLATVAKKVVLS